MIILARNPSIYPVPEPNGDGGYHDSTKVDLELHLRGDSVTEIRRFLKINNLSTLVLDRKYQMACLPE